MLVGGRCSVAHRLQPDLVHVLAGIELRAVTRTRQPWRPAGRCGCPAGRLCCAVCSLQLLERCVVLSCKLAKAGNVLGDLTRGENQRCVAVCGERLEQREAVQELGQGGGHAVQHQVHLGQDEHEGHAVVWLLQVQHRGHMGDLCLLLPQADSVQLHLQSRGCVGQDVAHRSIVNGAEAAELAHNVLQGSQHPPLLLVFANEQRAVATQ
mmetsp:Transcript_21702/g.55265  ORF Transcript_21702/g.55265 Transcript_21702/m.55265 type:complete len:209 (-) Transcript_21702:792-1418(-)